MLDPTNSLEELNLNIEDVIYKLDLSYDRLTIAAGLTQWGLRIYKTELSPEQFEQLLKHIIDSTHLL